jgi:hypothetical protein
MEFTSVVTGIGRRLLDVLPFGGFSSVPRSMQLGYVRAPGPPPIFDNVFVKQDARMPASVSRSSRASAALPV